MAQTIYSGYQGNMIPALAATIAISTQESSEVDCNGFVLCGVLIPAAFTGTTITFETYDPNSTTWVPIKNASGTVSYTVAQGNYYAINPVDFYGVRQLKVKSGSSEVAARTLLLSLRGF